MTPVVPGALAACAASALYNLGVALQAADARAAPDAHALRPALIAHLARRRRWLAGTALGIVGWPLHAAALLLAPLTVVQPALAAGLVLLLVVGARTLHQPVTRRDLGGVAAIVTGIAALAAAAPAASGRAAGGPAVLPALATIAAVALAPYVAARARRVGARATALAAGAAFAWSGIATKFVADAVARHDWVAAAAWTAGTALSAGFALLSEMTALRDAPAARVAPVVLAAQVGIPVLTAPLLTGDRWAHAPLGPAGILAALAAVIAGGIVLTTARGVRSAVASDSSADSATADRP
jgi:drug/metabolite transporter (DMT)-like permease